MEKNKKKSFNIILIVLFAAYLFFNGVLLMGHELWRDEANVWLLARDVSPLKLFREIRYQGHPCLWYLFVMPFAKLGLPFMTLSILSYLVMLGAAWIFVFRAPFHPLTKAVCLFSPIFSYYYPVVARNYCLIALLLLLLAWLYPKRKEKSVLFGALLGLLVQADTVALAAAGLISLMWFWESVKESLKGKEGFQPLFQAAKGLWIPLASLILWGMEFYQVSDSPEFHMQRLSFTEILDGIRSFSFHILTRMTGRGEGFDLFVILLFMAAALVLSFKMKNCWPALVTAGSFLFEVLFSILVYQLHIWHYIALCFVLIWAFFVSFSEKNAGKAGIWGRALGECLLIVLGVSMFIRWNSPEESSSLSNALNGVYSDGVHTAEYIRENIDKNELLIFTDVSEASTVQAYLGKNYVLYYAGSGRPETYANYNEDQAQTVSYEALLEWVRENFPEKEHFYLLRCPENCIEDIADEEKESWEICYQTEERTARGEEYTLYRITLHE